MDGVLYHEATAKTVIRELNTLSLICPLSYKSDGLENFKVFVPKERN